MDTDDDRTADRPKLADGANSVEQSVLMNAERLFKCGVRQKKMDAFKQSPGFPGSTLTVGMLG